MSVDKTGKEGDRGDKGAGPSLQQSGNQPSATEQLTSLFEEGKQYTGEEVVTAASKVIEDTLAADGRPQKDRADKAEAEVTRLTGNLDTVTNQVTNLSTQIGALTKAQEDAEADKVGEDPVALASLRARQANAREAARLEGVDAAYKAREAKMSERETSANQKETSVSIKLAAMAAGVDETKLAGLVPDGDPGRLANAASLLKSQVAPEIDPVTGKPKPAALTTTPASAISASGEGRSVAEKMLEDAKKK